MRSGRRLLGRVANRVAAVLVKPAGNQLPPPYEFVQLDAEQNLHNYLGKAREDIRLIVIVGAWHGEEIVRMLTLYPRCRFVCLEPNPSDFATLEARFADEPRVQCLQLAAGDVSATLPFVRTSPAGTSSLLDPNPADARLSRSDVIDVPVTRLDDLDAIAGEVIDCLWADVQGAEDRVLAGARDALTRTRSLFLEVATAVSPYVGGAQFDDLDEAATAAGFRLVNLGTDPANGEGNALWVRT